MARAQAVSLWRLLLPLLPGGHTVAVAGAGAGAVLKGDWSTEKLLGGPAQARRQCLLELAAIESSDCEGEKDVTGFGQPNQAEAGPPMP